MTETIQKYSTSLILAKLIIPLSTGLGQLSRGRRFTGGPYSRSMPEMISRLTWSNRGKTLGGSSSINSALYTRGMAAQYDAWSSLLETSDASVGWDWKGMQTYMEKVCPFYYPVSFLLKSIFSQRISLPLAVHRRRMAQTQWLLLTEKGDLYRFPFPSRCTQAHNRSHS